MEQLCSAPKLQLPTDSPRKADHNSARGGWLNIDIPEDIVRGVESFAASSGATLYMVLLSSLQLLLSARSSQDDIVVSHPCLASPRRTARTGPTGSLQSGFTAKPCAGCLTE